MFVSFEASRLVTKMGTDEGKGVKWISTIDGVVIQLENIFTLLVLLLYDLFSK